MAGGEKLKQIYIFLGVLFMMAAMVPVWVVIKGLDCLIFIIEVLENVAARLKR